MTRSRRILVTCTIMAAVSAGAAAPALADEGHLPVVSPRSEGHLPAPPGEGHLPLPSPLGEGHLPAPPQR
ncbi:hypothetical protein [Streptomyces longispororuber]|uniref:hypothetical protein n=1 Tax=Streptomyces longispororuber TaxID=68230 RepID=UPI0036F98AAB